jgi:hypothetical protein
MAVSAARRIEFTGKVTATAATPMAAASFFISTRFLRG